jgi:hypothetical protein
MSKTGPVTRESILELHADLSRRGFFRRTVKAAGIALFWDRFGNKMFGQSPSTTDPQAVLSGLGNVIVPVDSDPGWASWEPGITKYAWQSFVPQVLLGGNPLLYSGIGGVLQAFNDLPPMLGYSTVPFLKMDPGPQSQYYGDVLEGGFESFGTQDVMFLAAFVGLFAAKAVFYSNYPNHLAIPGAEFQSPPPPTPIPTAWQSIGFKGPVSQAEEAVLRAKYANVTILPGMDPNNTYI